MIPITGPGGNLETALPGEWAALMLLVAVAGVLGGMVLVVVYGRHEAGVRRRARARLSRGAVEGGSVDRSVRR